MKRTAFTFLSLVALSVTVGPRSVVPSTLIPATTRHQESAAGSIISRVTRSPSRDDDRAAIRSQVRENEAGTYIDDILLDRDSALARWHDRRGKPLTVWIQPATTVANWTVEYATRVREAFADWDTLGLPVHFSFVTDSTRADVHVTWIDHFTEAISGRTRWARDDDWWITDASIVLAVHHQQGETLDPDAMKAIALHEVGHLLGLDHTKDPDAIMAPRVRVRELSAADRATVKLIYSLRAGPIR